jgi:hypothetical protein
MTAEIDKQEQLSQIDIFAEIPEEGLAAIGRVIEARVSRSATSP